jgi:curli biogenesis system outer membrane secretion channel CsgG
MNLYNQFFKVPKYWILLICSTSIFGGCAVTDTKKQEVESTISRQQQIEAQKQALQVEVKTLKRKLAIGRFTNETSYGKTFQVDANADPLGKQASDMLASRLVASNKFLVFERQDISKLKQEQVILKEGELIGVDALVLGSVTEFGRSTTGKAGFLSSTKIQNARAKVEVRLVDARTGYAFFSATGTGEASTESGEIAGFGSRADYDGSLNDRAIGAAISDLQVALMAKLEERPWRTDILKVAGNKIFISGGQRQGIKVGDLVSLMVQGETVKSGQTGFAITLPPSSIGKAKVVGLFGDNESNEGAIAEIISGTAKSPDGAVVFVSEAKE